MDMMFHIVNQDQDPDMALDTNEQDPDLDSTDKVLPSCCCYCYVHSRSRLGSHHRHLCTGHDSGMDAEVVIVSRDNKAKRSGNSCLMDVLFSCLYSHLHLRPEHQGYVSLCSTSNQGGSTVGRYKLD